MDHHKYKIKVEYCVSALVILLGLFFILQALTINTTKEVVGPRTLPMILAISMVLGGIFLFARAYTDKAGDLSDGYGFLESDLRRILMMIACGALFIFAFWAFGYFVASVFTLIGALSAFGVTNWLNKLVSGVLLAVVFQWLFIGIMLLNDPKGAVLDMRPYTNWIAGVE